MAKETSPSFLYGVSVGGDNFTDRAQRSRSSEFTRKAQRSRSYPLWVKNSTKSSSGCKEKCDDLAPASRWLFGQK